MPYLTYLSSKTEKLIDLNAETVTGRLLNSPFFKHPSKAGWANYTKQANETNSLFIGYLDETNELLISENGGLGGAAEFRVFIKIKNENTHKSLMTLHFKSGLLSISTIKWLFILSLPFAVIGFYLNELVGYISVVVTLFLLILNALNWHSLKKVHKVIDDSLKQSSK